MAAETGGSNSTESREIIDVTSEPEEATSGDVERKKRSVIWGYFVINKENKSKVICLTCNEEVSRGGLVQSILTPLIFTSTCKVMISNSKNL